ncbi:hypothetical protein UY3_11117 [Chelonia mydas]|uniref:Uncharacterized protein n=1 Tax=Chelonia mydas TaxID=8469 RepID=M7B861_CHEMY|nr:hypothetical protein UY3_11117 [Chelonia mydas]
MIGLESRRLLALVYTGRDRSKLRNFSYVNSKAEIDVLRSTYRSVFTEQTYNQWYRWPSMLYYSYVQNISPIFRHLRDVYYQGTNLAAKLPLMSIGSDSHEMREHDRGKTAINFNASRIHTARVSEPDSGLTLQVTPLTSAELHCSKVLNPSLGVHRQPPPPGRYPMSAETCRVQKLVGLQLLARHHAQEP